jgi:hypothetical protein
MISSSNAPSLSTSSGIALTLVREIALFSTLIFTSFEVHTSLLFASRTFATNIFSQSRKSVISFSNTQLSFVVVIISQLQLIIIFI